MSLIVLQRGRDQEQGASLLLTPAKYGAIAPSRNHTLVYYPFPAPATHEVKPQMKSGLKARQRGAPGR